MSAENQHNPRQLPATAGAPGLGDGKIDVKRAVRCLFQQPEWLKTTFLGVAYFFVPLAGPLALQGWGVRVFKHIVTGGDDTKLPPLKGFGDLISLGIQPYVAAMIWLFPMIFGAQLILTIGLVIAGVLTGVIAAALKSGGAGNEVTIIVTICVAVISFLLAFVLFYAAIIAVAYPLQAMITLVETTGKLEYAWKFSEIRNFMSVLKPDYRKAFIRMQLWSLLIVFLGMLLCYCGMFPAFMIMIVAGAHLRGQLYRMYLARGGRPYQWNPKI